MLNSKLNNIYSILLLKYLYSIPKSSEVLNSLTIKYNNNKLALEFYK